jgi:SAM-dependent methyltransferase
VKKIEQGRTFMHEGSMMVVRNFRDHYLDKDVDLSILDVGSYDINGSYKGLFSYNSKWKYAGIDVVEGPNVDIVSRGAYDLGIVDQSYDIVISGNCLEHVEEPWKLAKEMYRVLKSGGLLCCVTPLTIPYHPYPIDCWRIQLDGYNFLFGKNVPMQILECSIHEHAGVQDTYTYCKK